jgi:lysophospholipase L1-like esterase
MGAKEGYDYPSQLERVLNTNSKIKFKVNNRGILVANTKQVLKRILTDIHINKPNMIIILAGGANYTNYWGYGSKLNNYLYRIRVFKLIRLLYNDIILRKINKKTSSYNTIYLEPEKYKNILKSFSEGIKQNPKDAMNYYNVGVYFLYERDFESAIEWFNKGITIDPYLGNNYLGIYKAYILMNPEALIKWLNNKYNNDNNNYHIINMQYLINRNLGNTKEANYWLRKINTYDNQHNKYYFKNSSEQYFSQPMNALEKNIHNYYLQMQSAPLDSFMVQYPNFHIADKYLEINNTKIFDWIKSDLELIIQICKDNGIRLILMNYPYQNETNIAIHLRPVNNIIELVAKKNSINLINNKKNFDALGRNSIEYYEPINQGYHPNEKGYKLMADDIYNYLIKNKLIGK